MTPVSENFFWDHFLGKLRDQAEFGNQALSSPHEPVGGYLRERVTARERKLLMRSLGAGEEFFPI